MKATSARVHVKTTVPPGESLVGVLPFNVIRLERVKLSPNPFVQLLTANHVAVPFDGRIHDLRAKTGGPTLGIGNHVSLFVRNLSNEPEFIELQIGGTTVDGEPSTPGEPSPDIGCKLVLGLFAQELEPEPWHSGPIPLSERLALAADHYATAKLAATDAIDAFLLSGLDSDLDKILHADARAYRLLELLHRLQAPCDESTPATLPERGLYVGGASAEARDDELGISPEEWSAMRDEMKARNGWTDAELDAHLLAAARDPSQRVPIPPSTALLDDEPTPTPSE